MADRELLGEEGKRECPLPTVHYYQRTYAVSLSDNDQKAVRVFRDYESKENLKRLQGELRWIKEGKALEKVCDQIVGKKRKNKYQGYDKWAALMLIWIAELNK